MIPFISVIESLILKNFKKYSAYKISGLSKHNFITGKNASGKTTILDAISLLNHKNLTIELCKKDFIHDFAVKYLMTNGDEIEISSVGSKKIYKLNDKLVSLAKLNTYFNVFYLNPHIHYNFFSTTDCRREVLNSLTNILIDSSHLQTCSEYSKLIFRRIKILQTTDFQNTINSIMLDKIEKQISEIGINVHRNRIKFCQRLNEFSYGKFDVKLDLHSGFGDDFDFNTFLIELKNSRNLDAKIGRTNVSIHRFDVNLECLISEAWLKKDLLSNSQKKVAILSLFLKTMLMLEKSKIIFLLDEYSAFFDKITEDMIFEKLNNIDFQFFATDLSFLHGNPKDSTILNL